MLKSLCIRNYALIEEVNADFSGGLIILTGETGAGKSIFIEAIGLLLGERASPEIVRAGAEKAVVEGVFAVAGHRRLAELLRASGVEPDEELLVRREVNAKGQSRCFINDSPATLAVLKQVAEHLVDLHGQHEHQSLLRIATHILMLDDVGGLDGMVAEFQTALARLREIASQLEELRGRERQLLEKRELYTFQAREIDEVGPRPGEEDELETERKILENAEKLFSSTAALYDALYGGEQSVRDRLVVARNQLQDLAAIDPQFGDAAGECGSAEAVVAELARFVQGYNARVEFNPERLEELRDRLGRLAALKKKYGGSLEAVIEKRTQLAAELGLAENFQGHLQALEGELEKARAACGALGQRLSAKRHEVARKIDQAIVQELAGLGIPRAGFTTRITQAEVPGERDGGVGTEEYVRAGKSRYRLNARGYDNVEFFITTNVGEEEQPLSQVASGGEISRIMLALKSILAKADRLPVLIFDEIDVGISGRIAQAVGRSLKQLSTFHQVIAITHLPQIAGLADTHFVVVKTERKGRTVSSLRRLDLDEQVREVAKLMSGTRITEAGLAGARELMGLT